MANKSVLELAVGTGQWDSGLKKAKQALDNFTSAQGGLQQALEKDNGDMTAFVKMMANMDSTAKTSKQQLREMTNVLTDFTTTYRTLTDEQKASPFGQEMAKAIQSLTERAGVLRDAMEDVQLSVRNAASDTRLFDQMAQGMSVATAGFQGLTGAGKLLGIEMGNDVEVIAKLQAAMAVTNSLTTIQTALQKQSALMQGLNAAKTALATAAQTAYAVATGEATVAQTAFNIAASANPYGLLLAGVGALVGVIAAFASTTGESTDALEDQKKVLADITRSVDAAAESYKRLADNMKSLGIGGKKEYDALIQGKKDQFQDVRNAWLNVGFDKKKEEERNGRDTEKWKALDEEQKRLHDEMLKVKKEYEELQRANKERVKRINEYARGNFNFTTESEVQSAIDFIKNQLKYKDPTSKDYGVLSKRLSELENIWLPQFQDTKKTTKINPTKAVKAVKEKSIDDIINEQYPDIAQAESEGQSYGEQLMQSILVGMAEKAQEADKNTLKNLMEVVVKNGIEGIDIPADTLMQQIIGDGADIPDEYWQNLRDQINEKLKDLGIEPIEIDITTGNISKKKADNKKESTSLDDLKKFNSDFSQITGGVNSIVSGIQQLGVDIPEEMQNIFGVLTGISSIMTGIASILTVIELTTSAKAVPIIGTFLSGGGVIHAAGGVTVPGNKFSGDLVPAYLNSGEMVLNKFQQQALAGTLENGGMKDISISGHLEGETIALSVDRWGKRSGRGELAFWKNQ